MGQVLTFKKFGIVCRAGNHMTVGTWFSNNDICTLDDSRTRSCAPSMCMTSCKVVVFFLPWEKSALCF